MTRQHSQILIIDFLERHGPQATSKIIEHCAKEANMPKNSVRRMLSKMHRKQFIAVASVELNREYVWCLTAKGAVMKA